tara:strand:+ start:377 stop:517 length:141 start_codon:yes stop_codon:yes gene_type:complete
MKIVIGSIGLVLAIWFGLYAAENDIGHIGAFVTAMVAYFSGRIAES